VPDRLDDLRRQRALQKEHLDWLDREIAALEGEPAGAEPPPLAPTLDEQERDVRDAEAILDDYRSPAADVSKRAHYGCFLYFGIAMAVLAVALAILYAEVKARRAREAAPHVATG
jgi:hypothetical protein